MNNQEELQKKLWGDKNLEIAKEENEKDKKHVHPLLVNIIIIIILVITYAVMKPPAIISEEKTNEVALKSSPFTGLSDELYSDCIDLGSNVMRDRNISKDLWESSYDIWESQCSLKPLLPIVKKNTNAGFPISPLDWANRK